MANLATLTSEVLRLLNEATNSSVGEVGDGSGTVTTTTSATIEAYLNEAIKETCRTCISIYPVCLWIPRMFLLTLQR
jgi:hypothetical protein